MGYPFGTIQQLLLLTAQRRGEVAAMRWDQLDLDRGTWRLTSADTKTGQGALLPLSPQVIDILRNVPSSMARRAVPGEPRRAAISPVSGFSKAKQPPIG